MITDKTFDFLKKLGSNNNRDWFLKHKKDYETAHQEMISFADALLERMNAFDGIETPSGKKSLLRIYRDVRFSKNKDPYKNYWGGGFRRATAARRGGYYFHVEPGNSFVGGGFWGPSKEDLLQIREQIALDATPLRSVLNSTDFKSYFGEMEGEQLKTAPKGFDKDHEDIDLLRYKQFLIARRFSDEEVVDGSYVDKAAESFKAMIPFFTCFTEYLTTDLNGESLLQ